MRFREALRHAGHAARANVWPGLLLQLGMGVFLVAYFHHEGTRRVLAGVAELKRESGFAFAAASYVFASAVLPEVLRIAFFQHGRPSAANLRSFASAAPLWAVMGVLVDVFYRIQILLFGSGHDVRTLVAKTVVDQFLVGPFLFNPIIVGWLTLCGYGFRRSGFREVFRPGFFLEHAFPVQVAGWCVWIPGVLIVYSMPDLLQIPVAVLIQCFWVLIMTTVRARRAD